MSTKEVDEDLVKQVFDIITHPAGFGVELFMLLMVTRLENGMYSVSSEDEEELFDDPRDAAIRFLEWRDEIKLGFDFERPGPN